MGKDGNMRIKQWIYSGYRGTLFEQSLIFIKIPWPQPPTIYHHHNHPRLRCPRHCIHGSPTDLGAGGADVATPQRQAAADVGSGAAAGCGATAGDDIVGWWLVSASKKSWDELGRYYCTQSQTLRLEGSRRICVFFFVGIQFR